MALWRAQSCKELIQTDLHYSPAETENRKQRSRGQTPPLFFLHSTGEYEHMISHMLTPPQPPIHMHTHGCESTQKHCGVHPGPTQPNFPATPIQARCPRRLSYETLPTQAHSKPLTEPQIHPAPPAHPLHTHTPPFQSTQASAPSIALALSLSR